MVLFGAFQGSVYVSLRGRDAEVRDGDLGRNEERQHATVNVFSGDPQAFD